MTADATFDLVQLLRTQRNATPDRVAIDGSNGIWTYDEVFAAAESLAADLRRIGVRNGDAVLISAPISVGAAISLLGVLLSGAVMVPVPDHLAPRAVHERREVAGARVVIAVGPHSDTLDADIVVSLDGRRVDVLSTVQQSGASDAAYAAVQSVTPAYIFFTSGTTGRVRGVLGIGSSVGHFLHWQATTFGIGPDDRVAFLTAVGFDVVLRNVFLPWSVGACLVVPPALAELDDVVGWLADRRVTVAHVTPSISENWIGSSRVAPVASSLRLTFFSGEVLMGSTVRRWRASVGSEQVVNLYGPTETCMIRTSYTVPAEVGDGPLPAGRPLPGTTVTLDHTVPAADEDFGEIIIHTPNGTLGYVGDEEAWLAVASPGERPGEWTYRTGDLGRFDSDGLLVVGGRSNDEVKVNGFRVDPADIAARLNALDGVATATAFVTSGSPETRELVAAVVPSLPGLTGPHLRARLAEELPPPLVPRWVGILDELPLTSNGKLDRKAVLARRETDEQGAGTTAEHAPNPALVDSVIALWRALFPDREVGPASNFFDLGGYSLQALRVLHGLREQFGVELSLRTLYHADTPSLVALELERALVAARVERVEELPPSKEARRAGVQMRLPATRIQRRYLDLARIAPELAASTLVVARTVSGRVDFDALDRALERLVARHDAIRTTFDVAAREQLVAEAAVIGFEYTDAIGVDDLTLERLLYAKAPPSLESWPLVRPVVMRHAVDCWIVAFVSHHAVVDSRSQDILMDDLRRLYDAEVSGREAVLAPLTIGAGDVVRYEQELDRRGAIESDVTFWRQRLVGRSLTLALPSDHPRRPNLMVSGAEVRTRLAPSQRAALEELAVECGGTLFRVLAGLWTAFLAGRTGEEEMVLSTPAMTREPGVADAACGMFVLRLPLLMRAAADESVRDVLRHAVTEVSIAGGRRHAMLEDVLGSLPGRLDPARTRPVHVGVNLLGWRERPADGDVPHVRWDWFPDVAERPIAELELRALASESRSLTLFLRYDAEVHDKQSMEAMLLDFVSYCTVALRDPNCPVGMIPIRSSQPRPHLHSLVASRAEAQPTGIALVDGDRSIDWASLEERVRSIAGALIAADIAVGDRVAIALDRGVDFVASVLAAGRVGAAFVPLALEAPDAWNEQVIRQSASSALLCNSQPTFRTFGAVVLRLDRPGVAFPCVVAARDADDALPACIIHTSGTSGQPKGVVLAQRNLAAHMAAAADEYGLTSDDVILQVFRVAFDGALDEVFLGVHAGCRSVVASDEVLARGPEAILGLVAEQQVTVMYLPTNLFHTIVKVLARPGAWFPESVRLIMVGGQAMDPEMVRRWHSWVGPRVRLLNGYGPAECTVWVTSAEITPELLREGEPTPIGRPLAGIRIRLVGEELTDVPVGEQGEILVAGDQVGIGYYGAPQLTAERFVVLGGERWYRTGDLARVRDDGLLVFLGRRDEQVKVLGYLVTPGPIESALTAMEDVAVAAVLPIPFGTGGDSVLVAFVEPAIGCVLDGTEVRRRIAQALPRYFVPTYVEVMPRIPRTAGEKPDRASLRPLAEAVVASHLVEQQAGAPARTIVQGTRREPAGPSQERFWLLRQMDDRDLYRIGCSWPLEPSIAEAHVREAVAALVEQHEVLRTRFEYDHADGLVQLIDEPAPPWWRVVDERDEVALRDQLHTRFDLRHEWPVRFGLVRCADGTSRLHMALHHIAGDAASLGVLTDDLRNHCRQLRGAEPIEDQVSRSSGAPQYAERVRAEREYLAGVGGRFDRDTAYWRNYLQGVNFGALEHVVAGQVPGAAVERHSDALSGAVASLLATSVPSLRTTPAVLIIAATAVVAARVSGTDDVVIGVPVSLRSSSRESLMVGPLINTLPLRIAVDPDCSFAELVEQVGNHLERSIEHRDLPFERIHPLVGGGSRLGWVVNVLEHGVLVRGSGDGVGALTPETDSPGARFDVTLTATVGQTVTLRADVSEAVDHVTAAGLVSAVSGVLANALADPARSVRSIALVDSQTLEHLERTRRDVIRPFPAGTRLDGLFAATVREHSSRTAVVDGRRRFSYAELDHESVRLAERLRAAGVEPGDSVALLLRRSLELVASVLAVVRLGAVYVPIDPSQPSRRTDEILEVASPRAVVRHDTDGVTVETRNGDARAVWPTPDGLGLRDEPNPGAAPLYAMFTSGSTGLPKGVVVPHSAVARLVCNSDHAQFGPDDVVALASNPAFDASTWELWGALLHGASLVVVDADTVTSHGRFDRLARQHGVTHCFVTTSLLHLFAALDPQALSSVRTLIFGGERCDPNAVLAVFGERDSGRLVHAYGPTESTTFALWHDVCADDVATRTVPIGRPLANTLSWIVDGCGHEVPPGVMGELCLGGPGLALGYLADPALTAERFVLRDSPSGSARAYRTGDLVRMRTSGVVEYLGRADRQVKVRGFRIQPEEIEAAMQSHPSVGAAAVLVEEGLDSARLIGVAQSTRLEVSELRRFLAERLPAAMVPAELVVVPELRLNANGKLDRAALLEARTATDTGATREASSGPGHTVSEDRPERVEPLSVPLHPVVEQLWNSTLGLSGSDPDTSFFDLGGYSLLAVRLLDDIRRTTGIELELSTLIEHRTLRAVSGVVSERESLARPPERDRMQVLMRPGSPPPIYLLHDGAGHIYEYQALVWMLNNGRSLIGVLARGREGSRPIPGGLRSMVRTTGKLLLERGSTDELVLAGFSSGAVIAVETVRWLQERGHDVAGLLLLDPSPLGITRPTGPGGVAYSGWSERVRWGLKYVRARLTTHRLDAGTRARLIQALHHRALNRYAPAPLPRPVPALLVQATGASTAESRAVNAQQWSALVGGVARQLEVDGGHHGAEGFLSPDRAAPVASAIDDFIAGLGR